MKYYGHQQMKTKTKPKHNKWENIEGRFNVAGVQYSDYQLIFKCLKPGTVVNLIGEPTNLYDSLAIRVEYKGIKLGYIPRHSIQQSELWNSHRRGCKCIGIITAFNKNNPTWCLITIQVKRTVPLMSKVNSSDIPL